MSSTLDRSAVQSQQNVWQMAQRQLDEVATLTGLDENLLERAGPATRPIGDDYRSEVNSHTVRLIRVGTHTVGIVSDSAADSEAIRQALLQNNAWNGSQGHPLLTASAALVSIFDRPGGL